MTHFNIIIITESNFDIPLSNTILIGRHEEEMKVDAPVRESR